jgi:hypothetical protein
MGQGNNKEAAGSGISTGAEGFRSLSLPNLPGTESNATPANVFHEPVSRQDSRLMKIDMDSPDIDANLAKQLPSTDTDLFLKNYVCRNFKAPQGITVQWKSLKYAGQSKIQEPDARYQSAAKIRKRIKKGGKVDISRIQAVNELNLTDRHGNCEWTGSCAVENVYITLKFCSDTKKFRLNIKHYNPNDRSDRGLSSYGTIFQVVEQAQIRGYRILQVQSLFQLALNQLGVEQGWNGCTNVDSIEAKENKDVVAQAIVGRKNTPAPRGVTEAKGVHRSKVFAPNGTCTTRRGTE